MLRFYESPTGYDGKAVWSTIHTAVDGISCDHCRTAGKALMTFAHDLVNAKLRKPLYDPQNFLDFQKKICAIRVCGKKVCSGSKIHRAA